MAGIEHRVGDGMNEGQLEREVPGKPVKKYETKDPYKEDDVYEEYEVYDSDELLLLTPPLDPPRNPSLRMDSIPLAIPRKDSLASFLRERGKIDWEDGRKHIRSYFEALLAKSRAQRKLDEHE